MVHGFSKCYGKTWNYSCCLLRIYILQCLAILWCKHKWWQNSYPQQYANVIIKNMFLPCCGIEQRGKQALLSHTCFNNSITPLSTWHIGLKILRPVCSIMVFKIITRNEILCSRISAMCMSGNWKTKSCTSISAVTLAAIQIFLQKMVVWIEKFYFCKTCVLEPNVFISIGISSSYINLVFVWK